MTDWKKSCTQCFEDESCCLSCCCPCCQIGKNAEAIGLGGFCACCCAAYCFAICTGTYVRFKVREKYNITKPTCLICCDGDTNCFDDFIMTLFCFCCSTIQQAAEIRGHGDFK